MIERSPYDLSGPLEAVLVLICFYGLGVVAWMREVRLRRMGADDFAIVVVGPFLWVLALRDLLLRFQQWYAPPLPDDVVDVHEGLRGDADIGVVPWGLNGGGNGWDDTARVRGDCS